MFCTISECLDYNSVFICKMTRQRKCSNIHSRLSYLEEREETLVIIRFPLTVNVAKLQNKAFPITKHTQFPTEHCSSHPRSCCCGGKTRYAERRYKCCAVCLACFYQQEGAFIQNPHNAPLRRVKVHWQADETYRIRRKGGMLKGRMGGGEKQQERKMGAMVEVDCVMEAPAQGSDSNVQMLNDGSLKTLLTHNFPHIFFTPLFTFITSSVYTLYILTFCLSLSSFCQSHSSPLWSYSKYLSSSPFPPVSVSLLGEAQCQCEVLFV